MTDYAIAESIANYWEEVYLKPNYRLFLYGENDDSAVPLRSVIPDRKTHAIAVLGYELKDGGMRPPSGQAAVKQCARVSPQSSVAPFCSANTCG